MLVELALGDFAKPDQNDRRVVAAGARNETNVGQRANRFFQWIGDFLITWLCSCCGLNMTISASASTFTLWPGGQ
jgi:hypothetical protein